MGVTVGEAVRRRLAPRGQGERLREEILAAAERLLIETGDQEAVSIRAVADAVGVTPPSIYLHFADKTELIFAICAKHFAELDRVLEEAAAGAADPLESIRLAGRASVRFGVDHPEEYRILFMTRPAATPEEWNEARAIESASFHHLLPPVQAAIDAGSIGALDPLTVSFGLWAAVHGLTSLLVAKPAMLGPYQDALIDHVIDVQIAGLPTARNTSLSWAARCARSRSSGTRAWPKEIVADFRMPPQRRQAGSSS